MAELDGKVAVVTDGTRGLGLGIAMAFIRAGRAVVVASRSQKSVDTAVQQVSETGGKASGIATDVVNLEQVEALARHAVDQFGPLDIWFSQTARNPGAKSRLDGVGGNGWQNRPSGQPFLPLGDAVRRAERGDPCITEAAGIRYGNQNAQDCT
jgi:NAD(P)-dependent dehydrogenase (short-subunit alcohol dehydrogenase family)